MKTIQELYNEVMNNEELKAQFIEAANAGKQDAFLKEHGCEAAPEQVNAFLKAKSEEDAPLSLDELENSAGGECNKKTRSETVDSIFSFGTICLFQALQSTRSDSHLGQEKPGEGRICNKN